MIELPKKVNVSGIMLNVCFPEAAYFNSHTDNERVGAIEFFEEIIRLNPLRCTQSRQTASVLIHEMLHGICMSRGVEPDEETVVTLAYGLLQSFMDSPDLLEYLQKVRDEK